MDERTEAYLRGKIEGSYEILMLLENIVKSQEVSGREEIIKYLVDSLKRHYEELLNVFPCPGEDRKQRKIVDHKELIRTAEDLLKENNV